MTKPKFTFRDLLAAPCILLAQGLIYLALIIGSAWTAKEVLSFVKDPS